MKKITLLLTLLICFASFGQIKQIKGKNGDATSCTAGGFNAIMYPNGFTGTIQTAYIGESTTPNWEFIANLAANPNGLGNANVFYIAEIIFDNNIPENTPNSNMISITSSDFALTSFAHRGTENTLSGCSFGATQFNKIRFNLEYVGAPFSTSQVSIDISVTDPTTFVNETITLTVIPEGALSVTDLSLHNFSFAPNPVKDEINISAASNISRVEFYNILGQRALHLDINATHKSLNISELRSGIYIMKATIDDSVGTYKIIKK